MALTAKERLAAAINRVVDPTRNSRTGQPNGIAPYFGAVLRGLIRREIDGTMAEVMQGMGMTPTLAVSKDGVLWWSAKFVNTLTTDELAAVLVHESMHVVLKHSERATALGIVPEATVEGITNAARWNKAADAAINQEIRKFAKLPTIFGSSCVFPETLGLPPGLTAEEYYKRIKDQEKQGGGQGKGKAGAAGQGHCGGCTQRPIPGEPPPSGNKAEGRSEAELERMRRATAEAVKEMSSKDRGTVPASLQRWADELLAPPKIPWRQKLARLVRGAVAYKSGAVDFNWKRPSRRQGGLGMGVGRPVMPSFHAPVPEVAVVIDTSGSMGKDQLTSALSEIKGVLSAVGANVTCVVCDATVHGIKPIRDVMDAAKMLKGGGGTAMAPALAELEKTKPRPQVVVVCTDGYIDEPPKPSFEVIWCIVGGNAGFKMEYGEVVHVEVDEKEQAA